MVSIHEPGRCWGRSYETKNKNHCQPLHVSHSMGLLEGRDLFDLPVTGNHCAVVTSLDHGTHSTSSEVTAPSGNGQEVVKDTRWRGWRIIKEHDHDRRALDAVNSRHQLH